MAGLSVAIVGSGFAGSILARILARQGHDAHLFERGAHPRFALGESSTPLAAICLERLAERYALDDLRDLAAYARWLDRIPEVRRGLKRGFTFYDHQRATPYRNDGENSARLLVAASPNDTVADTHWLREDVDHLLVRRAMAGGVAYRDRTEIVDVQPSGAGFRVSSVRDGKRLSVAADVLIDSSGVGGFLARWIPNASRLERVRLNTGLVFGHFTDVLPFAACLAGEADLPAGPYPDERAAVHHMIPEGWMYELPFDHGMTSAGFVVEAGSDWRHLAALGPHEAWRCLLSRHPTLEWKFRGARAIRPIDTIERLQRRLDRAAGPNWALLPHAFAFLSPLFSTGIAWSLLGVERLALVLESSSRIEAGLARYERLLQTEVNYLQRLIEGAYHARHDFRLFCAHCYLYFAGVSFAEASQRLCAAPDGVGQWAWDGIAGATDPVMRRAVAEARALLDHPDTAGRSLAAQYFGAVRRLIAPRNVAGLADPARSGLYPVDLDALVEHAHLLGLTPGLVRERLPRLRGGA